MLKSYKAFASSSYRLWLWTVYPILGILGSLGVTGGFLKIIGIRQFSFVASVPLITFCTVLLETIADFWFVPGLYGKETENTKLLQLSSKGIRVLKNALICDIFRRLIVTAFFYAANMLMGIFIFKNQFHGMEDIMQSLLYGVMSFGTASAMIIFARMKARLINTFFFAYIGAFFVLAAPGLLYNKGISGTPFIIVFAVIGIVCSVLLVKLGEKKIKESYHDEKSN